MQEKLGLEPLDAEHDRVMICGSMPMNVELKEFLEDKVMFRHTGIASALPKKEDEK